MAFGVALTRTLLVWPSHACMAFGVALTRINRKLEIQMETEALSAKTGSKQAVANDGVNEAMKEGAVRRTE